MTTIGNTCIDIRYESARMCYGSSSRSFGAHPLRSAKRNDFETCGRCMDRIAAGDHLSRARLAEIIEVASTMNRQKPRTELIRILRDHTPGPEASGEDMVPAAWRHAGRRLLAVSAQTSTFG